MIKTIQGSSRYIEVNGGYPCSYIYVNTGSGYMNVGDMRYNPSQQRVEIYDGNHWIEMNMSHAVVGLTPNAELALDWAIRKQREDMELEALSKSNPTIADLVNQKKELDHKIKMVQILIKEEPKVGTN